MSLNVLFEEYKTIGKPKKLEYLANNEGGGEEGLEKDIAKDVLMDDKNVSMEEKTEKRIKSSSVPPVETKNQSEDFKNDEYNDFADFKKETNAKPQQKQQQQQKQT